jgi:AcrR family transcriptional regulator
MARPKQVTDEELLKIALECFLEHGANVSVQFIADKVGLSQPALFKRFGTKEELFLRAVAPPEQLPVIEWIDASPSSGSLRPQLVQLLEKVWEMLSWVLPRVQLLQEARIPRETVMARYKTPPPVQLIMSIEGFFKRARQQNQVRHDLDPRFVAQWIFGALMGRTFLSKTMAQKTSGEENKKFVEATADLLWPGIKNDENGE